MKHVRKDFTGAEFLKSHQEFLGKALESSTTLASSWADLLKKEHWSSPLASHEGPLSMWGRSYVFGRLFDPAFLQGMFQEIAIIAAKELPELIEHRNDTKKLESLARRWKRSNEQAIGKYFGPLSPTHAERLALQWNELLSHYSSGTSGTSEGRAFDDFQRFVESLTAFAGLGPRESAFRVWSEAVQKTIGSAGEAASPFDPRRYEEGVRLAMEARKRFLDGITEFRKLIVSATDRVTDAVVEAVRSAGIAEVGGESYGRMLAVWLSKYEDAFAGLFGSEAFGRTLSETLDRAREAGGRADSLMIECAEFLKPPSPLVGEDVQNTPESLGERIGILEDRVSEISKRLDELLNKWEKRGENP